MGSVNRVNTVSVISLARKKCISQVLPEDVTLSNLFLDLVYKQTNKQKGVTAVLW